MAPGPENDSLKISCRGKNLERRFDGPSRQKLPATARRPQGWGAEGQRRRPLQRFGDIRVGVDVTNAGLGLAVAIALKATLPCVI
jgi:hypothetical protein